MQGMLLRGALGWRARRFVHGVCNPCQPSSLSAMAGATREAR